MQELRIPEKSGAAFELEAGERFDVIDPEGRQVADLVAFNADDPEERFSTKYSYRRNGKLRPSTGDALYTSEGREILTFVEDDCGIHDLLYAPCNHWVLSDYYDQENENGCRGNLTEALEAFGIGEQLVHSTLNVFMKSSVDDQTEIRIDEPQSDPGDTVTFETEQNCTVAVSSCAGESVVNAGDTNPIDIRVPEGTDIHTNF